MRLAYHCFTYLAAARYRKASHIRDRYDATMTNERHRLMSDAASFTHRYATNAIYRH